jgi:hypothetical protein
VRRSPWYFKWNQSRCSQKEEHDDHGRNDEGLHRQASGKLGQYMVQHALNRGYEVIAVCREESVGTLDGFKGRITIVPGANRRPRGHQARGPGCDGVLVVLVPRGVHGYALATRSFCAGWCRPSWDLV